METLSELDIPVRYGQPKIRVYLNRHGEEKSFLYSHCDYQGAPADGGVPWLSIKQGNGRSGLLSVTGEWIIAPRFDDVRAFNRDGVARVCDGGRWGIVNRVGEQVIPCTYHTLTPTVGGLSIGMTQQGQFLLLNVNGERSEIQLPHAEALEREWFDEFSPSGMACFHRLAGNRIFTGYINTHGEFTFSIREGNGESFSEQGIAPFSDESGQYGLIDKRGGWVVEPVYDLISHYDTSGFCCAQRWRGEELCAFYNAHGERVLEIETTEVPKIAHGIVRTGGKGGLYVSYSHLGNGKSLTSTLWSYGTDFYPVGAAIVRTVEGQWGILTAQGKFIHQRRWMEPVVDTQNAIVGFASSNTTVFIISRHELEYVDPEGKTVATLSFDRVRQTAVLKNAQQQVIRIFDEQKVWMP